MKKQNNVHRLNACLNQRKVSHFWNVINRKTYVKPSSNLTTQQFTDYFSGLMTDEPVYNLTDGQRKIHDQVTL